MCKVVFKKTHREQLPEQAKKMDHPVIQKDLQSPNLLVSM